MKRLLTTSLILTAFFSFAQPTIQWQKNFGGYWEDKANSILQTLDGGFIIAGMSRSSNGDVTGNHGNIDFWIVKLDNSGIIEWQQCFGGTAYDEAYSIQQTADSAYIVAGATKSINGDVIGNHGDVDFWIIKLDPSGNFLWQKCLGGAGYEKAKSIQQTTDGGYIVVGYSQSTDGDITSNHGGEDCWIVKIDNLGTIQWQKSLGGSQNEGFNSIHETTDGGYIIGGYSESNDGDVNGNHGSCDSWVVKIDNSGSIQWQKCLGGMDWEQAYSIQQTADGGYIFAGHSSSNDGDVNGNHGNFDYWIVKLDNSGSIQWQKCLGGMDWEQAYSIQQTNDSGYIVAGLSSSNDGDVTGNHGNQDYWVLKLDNLGSIQWQKTLGGTEYDVAKSIQQTGDGGYIVAGYSDSNNGDLAGSKGYQDYWIVKLSGTANGIAENLDNDLLYIYPNPTNGTFTLETTEEGIYSIVNELGQTFQEIKLNNTNNYTVNVSNLNTGIYFIVGYNNEKMTRQKIVITK